MTEKLTDMLMQISLIEKKRSAGLCSRFADKFEDDLLEYEAFPDAHLEFFLTLLSSEQHYNKPGIWNFVLAVNNAKDALSRIQYESIADAFATNFGNYSDKELCLAVCDFIARNLEPAKAANLLKQLKEKESQKSPDLQGYVDEGFFILEQEIKRAGQGSDKTH